MSEITIIKRSMTKKGFFPSNILSLTRAPKAFSTKSQVIPAIGSNLFIVIVRRCVEDKGKVPLRSSSIQRESLR